MTRHFISTSCGLYHTQNQFTRWSVWEVNFEVIKHLPRYESIVCSVVTTISKDNLLSPLEVFNTIGLPDGYGVNFRNFIIKFACIVIKAITSKWHFFLFVLELGLKSIELTLSYNENCKWFAQITTCLRPCLDQLCCNRKTQKFNMLRACEYMSLNQQVCIIKSIGLTNQLETHKWWFSRMGTKQSWINMDINGRL